MNYAYETDDNCSTKALRLWGWLYTMKTQLSFVSWRLLPTGQKVLTLNHSRGAVKLQVVPHLNSKFRFALLTIKFLDWRPIETGRSWTDARSTRGIVPQGKSLGNSNFYLNYLKVPYPYSKGYVEDHNGWNYLTPGYSSHSQDQGYFGRYRNEHSNGYSSYSGYLSSGGQGKLAKSPFVWSLSFVGWWALFQEMLVCGCPERVLRFHFHRLDLAWFVWWCKKETWLPKDESNDGDDVRTGGSY